MDFIISLAHFCEVHGPTSILCTQIVPSRCATCHPCVTPPADEPHTSSFSGQILYDDATMKLQAHPEGLGSPFETPPTSPRSIGSGHNPYFPATSGRHSSRRNSGSFDGDGEVCENCTFLVPKDISERLPDGAPGSPTKDGRGRNGSPVLRSTQAVLAHGSSVHFEDGSSSPELSDAEESKPAAFSRRPASFSMPAPPFYPPPNTHMHNLTYLTTRQPASPSAYSLLRRSCIRTLSCEMLPRGSPSGPLWFGDSVAGHTIAYIFRLPDPRARGKRRTYALIALGGRDSRRVGMAMVKITAEFEAIANSITSMADRVLERESSAAQSQFHQPYLSGTATPPLSSSASSMPAISPQKSKSGSRSSISTPSSRNITPVSSFLAAKKLDPDGYPRVSREVMRAKGLAEIVGDERFFVNLHTRFVKLLHGLIREFGC